MHVAHVALMLRDAFVTPRERRVALLEFANSIQRRSRSKKQNQLHSSLSACHSWPWTMETGRPSFSLEKTTSRSRTAGQSYPRARRGSTRVHRGKCSSPRVCKYLDRRCLGRCHCMRLGRRRFGWGCPFVSHRRGFGCKIDRTRLHRVSRVVGG